MMPAQRGPATALDAQIILQLCELRRESEMRKARDFISAEFWPETANDTLRIARSYPSQQNTWLRQVTSYLEMAASFVLRGARSVLRCQRRDVWKSLSRRRQKLAERRAAVAATSAGFRLPASHTDR
jgi:hypothetical protein